MPIRPSISRRLASVRGLAFLAVALTSGLTSGCRGRVTVDEAERPFDAATETLRAEASQLAARADARLRTLTDSSAAAQVRASRDSILTALGDLATRTDSSSRGSRQALRDLDSRILDRLRRLDSIAASASVPPPAPR